MPDGFGVGVFRKLVGAALSALSIGVVLGAHLGARLSRRLSGCMIQRLLDGALVALGLRLVLGVAL